MPKSQNNHELSVVCRCHRPVSSGVIWHHLTLSVDSPPGHGHDHDQTSYFAIYECSPLVCDIFFIWQPIFFFFVIASPAYVVRALIFHIDVY